MNAVPAWSAVGVIGMLFVSGVGDAGPARLGEALGVAHDHAEPRRDVGLEVPDRARDRARSAATPDRSAGTEVVAGAVAAARGRVRRTGPLARRGRCSGRCPPDRGSSALKPPDVGQRHVGVVAILRRAVARCNRGAGALGELPGSRMASATTAGAAAPATSPTRAKQPAGRRPRISTSRKQPTNPSETRNLVRPRGRVKGRDLAISGAECSVRSARRGIHRSRTFRHDGRAPLPMALVGQISGLLDRWTQALVDGDVARIRSFMTPGFSITSRRLARYRRPIARRG